MASEEDDNFILIINKWLENFRKGHSVIKLSYTKALRSFEGSSCSLPAKIKLSLTFFQKSSIVPCSSFLLPNDFFLSKMYWFTRHRYFPLGYLGLLSPFFTFLNPFVSRLALFVSYRFYRFSILLGSQTLAIF